MNLPGPQVKSERPLVFLALSLQALWIKPYSLGIASASLLGGYPLWPHGKTSSSRDRQKALLLCTKLEEAGVAYFLDEKEIKPGDELPSTRISDCTERGAHNTYFLVVAA